MLYRSDEVVDVALERGDGVRQALVKCVGHVFDVMWCVEFLGQLQELL